MKIKSFKESLLHHCIEMAEIGVNIRKYINSELHKLDYIDGLYSKYDVHVMIEPTIGDYLTEGIALKFGCYIEFTTYDGIECSINVNQFSPDTPKNKSHNCITVSGDVDTKIYADVMRILDCYK
jgi:hypothetical protein